ncbi:MAG TPA: hypothetical protein VL349_11030, partial [Terriglobales bacterium]|nr:hypothetical protein [Terriglobales bacterium]
IPVLDHGELDESRWNCLQPRQGPDELIQSRSQVVKSISDSENYIGGNVEDIDPKDVPLIFRIVLTPKSIGVRFREDPKLRSEGFKVFLRPTQFQLGISYSGHDAPVQA